MKILHVTYDEEGGASIGIKRLNKALIKNKIDSEIFYFKKYLYTHPFKIEKLTLLIKWKFAILQKKILFKFFCKRSNKETVSLNFTNVLNISKIIKEKRADLVHLHWVGNEMLSVKNISEIKKPVIWTLHDMWPFSGIEHFRYDNRIEQNYSQASRNKNEGGIDFDKINWKQKKKYFSNKNFNIIAPSEWILLKARLSKIFKSSLFIKLPYILNLKKWKKSFKIKKILKKKVLLFSATSSVNYRKGFRYLLEAINKYLDHEKYVLIVVGEKPKKFDDLKIEKKYLGIIKSEKRMINIYKTADIFVLPSLAESFGQVFVEAGSLGLPCVAFGNTAASEIISHKKNGYLAIYRSSKDLAMGIDWSYREINSNNKLKQSVRNLVVKKFSDQNKIHDYIHLYKKIYARSSEKIL
jgi:glycosyltransferase involved in cell wall biosynthesis